MTIGIHRQGIAMIALAISIITVTMLIAINTFAQSVNPKPIIIISTDTYQVNYYNVTGIRKPILIIHGYLNNNPVPLTISYLHLAKGISTRLVITTDSAR
ncbi:hypothetical protein [Vulcanisaeta souniana]|uniref:hypothetical protein n=1 Tax=Vulcanisaeta souniana TaxID=164452 RepID=UPI000ADC843D|nr:hypothetical protein [Vulcanisaeta souniana]